jgi:hypothetical protein
LESFGFVVHEKLDFDECVGEPCPEGNTCTNTLGSYSCDCNPGFVMDMYTGVCGTFFFQLKCRHGKKTSALYFGFTKLEN